MLFEKAKIFDGHRPGQLIAPTTNADRMGHSLSNFGRQIYETHVTPIYSPPLKTR